MKICYCLLTVLFTIPQISLAQQNQNFHQNPNTSLTTWRSAPIKGHHRKALGDTIYYQDFDSLSVVNDITIIDNSGASRPWIWASANTPPGGPSTTRGPLTSPSQGNGFMMLPIDRYNTNVSGPVDANTYFQIGPIDLRDSIGNPRAVIEATWFQAFRVNGAGVGDMTLQVSTDGVSWTAYEATELLNYPYLVNNTPFLESYFSVNLSQTLGNANFGYFRFSAQSFSYYYWMIDDLTIREGPVNNLDLIEAKANFHPYMPVSPRYYEVPLGNVSSIDFNGNILNDGANTQTGVRFSVDVRSDSLIGGGSGFGQVCSNTNLANPSTLLPFNRATANNSSSFSPNQPSHYTINYNINSDSVNQQAFEASESATMTLTVDTTIALERGEQFFDGVFGPGSFINSAGIGDVAAALMVIDSSAGFVTPTSLSFFVSSEAADSLHGLTISPRIWSVDTSQLNPPILGPVNPMLQAVSSAPALTSSYSLTIDTCTTTCPINQSSMMDKWVSLSFPANSVLGPGMYYYGIEHIGGNGRILGARDPGAELRAPVLWDTANTSLPVSNMYYLNGGPFGPIGWLGVPTTIGLRFNGLFPNNPLITDLEEARVDEDQHFHLFPNPNEGIFTLEIENAKPITYEMRVSNTLGQTIISDEINVNGTWVKQLDLSSFGKGVYFVSLENGKDKLVKKLLVK